VGVPLNIMFKSNVSRATLVCADLQQQTGQTCSAFEYRSSTDKCLLNYHAQQVRTGGPSLVAPAIRQTPQECIRRRQTGLNLLADASKGAIQVISAMKSPKSALYRFGNQISKHSQNFEIAC
jgi:hypothetical protein